MITPEQQKLLQAAAKKKWDEEAAAAWIASNKRSTPPFLSKAFAGAGGKRFKRDWTNSPCHLCQLRQIGNWQGDPMCDEVLSIMQQGLKFDFEEIPPQYFEPNNKSCLNNSVSVNL